MWPLSTHIRSYRNIFHDSCIPIYGCTAIHSVTPVYPYMVVQQYIMWPLSTLHIWLYSNIFCDPCLPIYDCTAIHSVTPGYPYCTAIHSVTPVYPYMVVQQYIMWPLSTHIWLNSNTLCDICLPIHGCTAIHSLTSVYPDKWVQQYMLWPLYTHI